MKKIFFIVAYFAYFFSSGQSIDSLTIWLNQFNNEISPAQWSFVLVNTKNESLLIAKNHDKFFIPASVQKLLVTAAAIHALGKDYRFSTRFLLQGQQKHPAVWDGNLLVVGLADPTLGVEELDSLRWIDSLFFTLKQLNIDSFTGRVIGIAAFFDSTIVPTSYSYEDMGNYFGAGTASLVWGNNQVKLYFKTGKTGEPAELYATEPAYPGTEWINRVKAGKLGTGDYTLVYGKPFEMKRIIEGTLPPHKDTLIVRASAPNPALYAAYAIQQKLTEKGIKFQHTAVAYYHQPKLPDTTFIFLRQSPPLLDIITYTNTFSSNVTAETLLKYLGKIKKNQGSYTAGIEYLYSFLQDTLKLSWSGKIVDGSGLSQSNTMKPAELMQFLLYISTMPWFPDYLSTFPIAGETGTLKKYFQLSSLRGNLKAKTGTLKGVRTLAGYFSTNLETYAFVFFVQGYKGNVFYTTQKMERLLNNIYNTLNYE